MLTGRDLGRIVDGRTLFEGVDLDVTDGLLWIRGPSGVGKSELLRRVACLVPGDGELALDGVAPASMGLPSWRARVVLVAQQAPRFPGSGRDAWLRIEALAAQQARDHLDPVDQGRRWGLAADRWDIEMARLSGGEAQRMWLAMVLACQPDVVLLDEPTAALDPEATAAVEADLRGRIGLLVTHDAAQGGRLAQTTLEIG